MDDKVLASYFLQCRCPAKYIQSTLGLLHLHSERLKKLLLKCLNLQGQSYYALNVKLVFHAQFWAQLQSAALSTLSPQFCESQMKIASNSLAWSDFDLRMQEFG